MSKANIEKGTKSTLISIFLNLCLALIKGLAGFWGNSYALIADAIESTSDVFTSLIVWIGLRASTKVPDEKHPYGQGKAEPLAALVVALALIGAAIIIAIQSVEQIITPHHTPAAFTLLVLILVIVVKELLFRYVVKIGDDLESTALKADAWHHRSDAITSFTAFVGISIALIGGKGYESADDWAAMIASVFIVINAYKIFMEAFREIMDAAPPSEIENEIRAIASKVPQVAGLEKCRVRKMGFAYYVDLHVEVDGNLTVDVGHEIAHQVKDAIILQKPNVADVLVHIEPHP